MIGYACADLDSKNEFPVVGDLPSDTGEPRLTIGARWIPIWKIEFDAPVGFEFPPTEKLCDPRFPRNLFPRIHQENVDADGCVDEMSGTLVIAGTKHNPYARVKYRKLAFMRRGRTEEPY